MEYLKCILNVAENVITVNEANVVRAFCNVLVQKGFMSIEARVLITRRIGQALYYNAGITGYSSYVGAHEIYRQ